MKTALLLFFFLVIVCSLPAQIRYTYDASGNRTSVQQDSTSPPKPVISVVNDTTLSTTTANYYQWFVNNDTLLNQTDRTLSINKVGFYKVGTSPNKKCWAYSDDYPIIVINEPHSDSLNVLIYPNPSNGNFTIDVKLDKATGVVTYATVYNELGSLILQTNKLIFFTNEIKIPITLSANGTYNVKVTINGNFKMQQVLIMK